MNFYCLKFNITKKTDKNETSKNIDGYFYFINYNLINNLII